MSKYGVLSELDVPTRLGGVSPNHESLIKIRKAWPNVQVRTVYGYGTPITMLTFENTLDVLVFTLRYGEEYV